MYRNDLATDRRGAIVAAMSTIDFRDIETWVFDLDNTLYPPSMMLFDQIEVKMTDWVEKIAGVDRETAGHLRKSYWRDHGTTLAGLMALHDMPPEPFLTEVHDISFAPLSPDAELRNAIQNLPGRKIIYTNGTRPYAEKVVEGRGLTGLFDGIYGVEHAGFVSKPAQKAFDRVFDIAKFNPETATMFEDEARNLEVPAQLGLKTVHVSEAPQSLYPVDCHTNDLTDCLAQIVATGFYVSADDIDYSRG